MSLDKYIDEQLEQYKKDEENLQIKIDELSKKSNELINQLKVFQEAIYNTKVAINVIETLKIGNVKKEESSTKGGSK